MRRKKRLFSFIIILLVLLVVMIGVYEVLQYKRKHVIVDGIHTQEDLDLIDEQIDNYLSDKIVPVGLSKLYGAYKGSNDLNDMYRGIYSFVNYISKVSKKVDFSNEKDISNFYQKNKDDIKKNLGLLEEKEFIKVIKYLDKTGYNGQNFIDCKLDSSTFAVGGGYFSYKLTFNFENLEGKVDFKLYFANYPKNERLIYFSVLETE